MRALFGSAVLLAVLTAAPAAHAQEFDDAPSTKTLCGWWANPTPANVVLFDDLNDWQVSRQGADGPRGDYPRFPPGRWIHSGVGGSYGYGCACIHARVAGSDVQRIFSATSRPLAACRASKRLRTIEKQLK